MIVAPGTDAGNVAPQVQQPTTGSDNTDEQDTPGMPDNEAQEGDEQTLDQHLIDGTDQPGCTPMTIGQALQHASQGTNIHGLRKHWKRFNQIDKANRGNGSVESIVNHAKKSGMIGYGVHNAATKTDPKELTGWTPAPHLGPGTVVGSPTARVPSGYKLMYKGKRVQIATPAPNAHAAAGAIGAIQRQGL